jgi:tRNA (guanine37-N1)-methyltransferase
MKKVKVIITSPRGKQFDATFSRKLVKNYKDIIIICGHYEGIDVRVKKALRAEEISVGPYTLTGGELPALIMTDCLARLVPGVLGKKESLEEGRVASKAVYTRPEALKWKGKNYKVPKVLLSGDHKRIEEWRKDN